MKEEGRETLSFSYTWGRMKYRSNMLHLEIKIRGKKKKKKNYTTPAALVGRDIHPVHREFRKKNPLPPSSSISILIRILCRRSLRPTHRHPTIPEIPIHPSHTSTIPSCTPAITPRPTLSTPHRIHIHIQPDPSPNLKRLALLLEILLQSFTQQGQFETSVQEGFAGGDVGVVFRVGVGGDPDFYLVIQGVGDSVACKGDVGVEEELARRARARGG